MSAKKDYSIENGMLIAAAIIASSDETLAEEILGAAGLTTMADLKRIRADEYDIEKVRHVIEHMDRRAENRRRARASA